MGAEFKYWAFISYSHADKKWGDWLHSALETFKVPKALAGAASGPGEPIPSKIFPIFRDREELPTSSDLGSMITQALHQSRLMIVICSPRAAKSRWVNQEILDFKKLGGAERILALIVDGEPNAADGKPDFSVEAECFPEALKYALGADGNLDRNQPTEPIAADARPGMDGKTGAKLKLVAGILGINYDDLKRREERRRHHQQRIVVAVSAALVLIFAGLAAAAILQSRLATQETKEANAQKQEAERQKVEAITQRHAAETQKTIADEKSVEAENEKDRAVSRQLVADSMEQKDRDPEKSILLAMQAVNATVGFSLPPVPAATTTLHSAILGSQVRMTLRGHEHGVNSVAFSPDGRRLATASDDQTAKIWDSETGKGLKTLPGHVNTVTSVAFSPDGKRLATASADETAKIWNAQTGKELMTLSGHADFVFSVAFSPDGRRVATGSNDKTAKIWDAETGKELMTLHGHGDVVRSVAFSPDGRRLATGSSDDTAKIWDAETGKELTTLHGHEGAVYSVAFSPDGRRLATASGDKTAKIWDAQTGKELTTLHGHEGVVESVAFSPDGGRLATASWDNTAKIWETTTGKELTTLRGHEGWVTSVAFSPDGRRLATGSTDDTAKIPGRRDRQGADDPARARALGRLRRLQPPRQASGNGKL